MKKFCLEDLDPSYTASDFGVKIVMSEDILGLTYTRLGHTVETSRRQKFITQEQVFNCTVTFLVSEDESDVV